MNEALLQNSTLLDSIDTILFDLGAVLYEISLERSVAAFVKLIPEEKAAAFPSPQKILAHPVFKEFEVGKISPAEFRGKLRVIFDVDATDEELNFAWNQVLIGVQPAKKVLVAQFATQYRLFLLSNTNQIHERKFWSECEDMFSHMQECFFSHKLGLRKPDPEIYEEVIRRAGLTPQKTLFVDDNQENLIGAGSVGLQVYHYRSASDLQVLADVMFNLNT